MGKAGDKRLATRLMLVGTLNKLYNLRHGALAECLACLYTYHTSKVDTSRHNLVFLLNFSWTTLACQCDSIERCGAFYYNAVEWYLLTGSHNNGLAYGNLLWLDSLYLTVSLHIGYVGSDIHKVRYAVPALALCITLKHLAYLEEEHNKHCLRELCLCSWQEAYAQCTDSGYRHKEVLVEHITLDYTLRSLA